MTKQQFLTTIYANEDQFQVAAYRFINANYPELRKLIFHVPNGGNRNQREAMKLKSMGTLAGCPDLVCISPVFGLELKMPNGVQSEKQKEIQAIWCANNVPYVIAYNAEQVINHLKKLLPCHREQD